jgi:acetyl esterase/lipase
MINKVHALLNIKYGQEDRQSLNMYLPDTTTPYTPVLFFVHGGGWSSGDREMYSNIGYFYAKKGFITLIVDHRLYPQVRHPDHIQDVAKAFAWTKENISYYNGDAENIYICGHSSGAHLVSLLATNEEYLNEEGLKTSDIKGVIAVSGIYSLGTNLTLAGYGDIFPTDKDRVNASPLNFIKKETPPFLIMYAQNEILTFSSQAITFYKSLQKLGVKAKLKYIKGQTHTSIITSMATRHISSMLVIDFIGYMA